MVCIEPMPPKGASIFCHQCSRPCGVGRRRRDPFGSFYCALCGPGIQAKVRRAIRADPELEQCCGTVRGFCRYVPPALIGLGHLYTGVDFQYVPAKPLPKHDRCDRGTKRRCFGCSKQVETGASKSRRGFRAGVSYCAVCGWRMRRAMSRTMQADRRVRALYTLFPQTGRFLRPDIVAWLST